MNINDHLRVHDLPQLPMRAWLACKPGTTEQRSSSTYVLEDCWVLDKEQPLLSGLTLHVLNLGGGMTCLALVGAAITQEATSGVEHEVTNADERALIYLLNPADTCVWQAIHGWTATPPHRAQILSGGGLYRMPLSRTMDFGDAPTAEGNELDSDMLAGQLRTLLREGRLGEVLKAELGIRCPVFCAIVETPMMCASMRPLTPEQFAEAEAYLAHKAWAASLED